MVRKQNKPSRIWGVRSGSIPPDGEETTTLREMYILSPHGYFLPSLPFLRRLSARDLFHFWTGRIRMSYQKLVELAHVPVSELNASDMSSSLGEYLNKIIPDACRATKLRDSARSLP